MPANTTRRTLLSTAAVVVFATTIPTMATPSSGSSFVRLHPGSQSFAPDTYRQMLANQRTTVALAKRGSIAFASGVLVSRDLVLTANHCTFPMPGYPKRYRPTELEVWFDYDAPVPEGSSAKVNYPVLAYAYTSPSEDFVLLRIGPSADGTYPTADRVATLSNQHIHRQAPVYVIHHPLGQPVEYADGASVVFPYVATDTDIAAMLDQAASPSAAREIKASYQPHGAFRLRNASVRWAHCPTLGIDSETSKGSSGGPVFDKRTHKLVGILYAGTRRTETSWEHHEAVVPWEVMAAAIDDNR